MNKAVYVTPVVEIQVFGDDPMAVSGGGGGVVLPDDEW